MRKGGSSTPFIKYGIQTQVACDQLKRNPMENHVEKIWSASLGFATKRHIHVKVTQEKCVFLTHLCQKQPKTLQDNVGDFF